MPWSNQSGGGGRRGGGGGGPWGQGPSGGPHQQPDLEELLKRSQDRLKQVIPGGGAPSGLAIFLLMLAGALAIAYYAFFFVVRPDEAGVVLRFGKFDRQVTPGLHFRLPYPVEEVRLPKFTKVNQIEIGVDAVGRVRSGRDLQDESLMLTGDENIVVVGFVVQWKIRDARKYLFNIQNPDQTVREVAESAMRDVVGQSEITPLITGAREKTETEVKKLMQEVLDYYGAGIDIIQVRMLKSEPPPQVIDAFRDVQAAQADKEKYQNEAFAYSKKATAEAKGEADRIVLGAKGYQQQTIAEAEGQAARFLKVYEEYKKAPEVTRKRLYLETMERLLAGSEKIVIDGKAGSGVVPYLPLDELHKRKDGGN